MDRNVSLASGVLIAMLGIFSLAPVNADTDAEEYRLLKSWGMKFNAEGELRFQRVPADAPVATSPWQPDVSAYRSRPQEQSPESLEPLVITSKQQADKK